MTLWPLPSRVSLNIIYENKYYLNAVTFSAGFYNAVAKFYVDNHISTRYHKQLNKLG